MTKKSCADCGAEHRSNKSKIECRIRHGKGPKSGGDKRKKREL